jgi:hypothetical protein
MNILLTYSNGEQALIRVADDWEAHEFLASMESRADVVECVIL